MVDLVRKRENSSGNWAGRSIGQAAAAPGLIDYGSQEDTTVNK